MEHDHTKIYDQMRFTLGKFQNETLIFKVSNMIVYVHVYSQEPWGKHFTILTGPLDPPMTSVDKKYYTSLLLAVV